MRERMPWRCAAQMLKLDGSLVECNMPREVGAGTQYCFYHGLVAAGKVTEFQAPNSRGSWDGVTGWEIYFPWPLTGD